MYPWKWYCNLVDECNTSIDCSKNSWERNCCWGHCQFLPCKFTWNPNPRTKCNDRSDCQYNQDNIFCCPNANGDKFCSPIDCPPLNPIDICHNDLDCAANAKDKYCCSFHCVSNNQFCDRNPIDECCENGNNCELN